GVHGVIVLSGQISAAGIWRLARQGYVGVFWCPDRFEAALLERTGKLRRRHRVVGKEHCAPELHVDVPCLIVRSLAQERHEVASSVLRTGWGSNPDPLAERGALTDEYERRSAVAAKSFRDRVSRVRDFFTNRAGPYSPLRWRASRGLPLV